MSFFDPAATAKKLDKVTTAIARIRTIRTTPERFPATVTRIMTDIFGQGAWGDIVSRGTWIPEEALTLLAGCGCVPNNGTALAVRAKKRKARMLWECIVSICEAMGDKIPSWRTDMATRVDETMYLFERPGCGHYPIYARDIVQAYERFENLSVPVMAGAHVRLPKDPETTEPLAITAKHGIGLSGFERSLLSFGTIVGPRCLSPTDGAVKTCGLSDRDAGAHLLLLNDIARDSDVIRLLACVPVNEDGQPEIRLPRESDRRTGLLLIIRLLSATTHDGFVVRLAAGPSALVTGFAKKMDVNPDQSTCSLADCLSSLARDKDVTDKVIARRNTGNPDLDNLLDDAAKGSENDILPACLPEEGGIPVIPEGYIQKGRTWSSTAAKRQRETYVNRAVRAIVNGKESKGLVLVKVSGAAHTMDDDRKIMRTLWGATTLEPLDGFPAGQDVFIHGPAWLRP